MRVLPCLSLALVLAVGRLSAQQYAGDHPRFEEIGMALTEIGVDNPAVNRGVDITLTGSLREFAIVFSRESGLNLTVDPRLTQQVVANFTDTKPADILIHLARFYDLDLVVDGTILSLVPFDAPQPARKRKLPQIQFEEDRGLVTFDLRKDTLDLVVRELTRLTGENITVTPRAGELPVEGFTRDSPLPTALEQLATRNNLYVSVDEEGGFYVLDVERAEPLAVHADDRNRKPSPPRRRSARDRRREAEAPEGSGAVAVRYDSLTEAYRYSVSAERYDLGELVGELMGAADASYLPLGDLDREVDFRMTDQPLDDLLGKLLGLNGYGFRRERGTYLVGEEDDPLLNAYELIELQHRSVKELTTALPVDLLQGLQVSEFHQLNALIVSGPADRITGLRSFLDEVDRQVPVVMIELLIVDVQKSTELATGVQVGVGEAPVKAAGTVFPEADLTLSSRSINQLLDLLAGNGIINLGQVTPDFYARVRAAEDHGIAKVHSKPRLSTINGQEATLSIGETRYYQIQRTTLAGNLNPVTLQDRTFESVNADFTINILPIVSGDGGVTLEIDVSQTDFVGRLQSDAPPAQVSRAFNSLIRMGDGEMVVLGGLESRSVSDAGRGVPFLSRIPVIKWFFSSRLKSRGTSRLLVFVRPRVLY